MKDSKGSAADADTPSAAKTITQTDQKTETVESKSSQYEKLKSESKSAKSVK